MRIRLVSAAVAMAVIGTAAIVDSPTMAVAVAGSAMAAVTENPSPVRRVCDEEQRQEWALCLALIRTTAEGAPLTSGLGVLSQAPAGYSPAHLQAAYQLASAAASAGSDKTVAVVNAYDNPNAEADLAVYRKQFGLPPCTTDNGCFRKVNQNGQPAPLPPPDHGWASETSLDIQMVSAICPRCHILLVESDDNHLLNLAASVATAAKLGADAVSNSYGLAEFPGILRFEPFYNQPGVMLTAAAGDSGYGVSYPATSATVTAVGGTSLWPANSSRGWTEKVWARSGSGCSTQIPKPAWQHDPCSRRMANDVAAVADTETPVAVYDTYGSDGWVRMAGTSVSAPIVAAAFALAGNRAEAGPSYFAKHPDKLFDVTTGVNGACSPSYLCTAGPGYDGPTGFGTPNVSGVPDDGESCVSGWSVSPPQESPTAEQLVNLEASLAYDTAVAALSPANVWTVGFYNYHSTLVRDRGGPGSEGMVTHIEHWNGSKWQRIPSPNTVDNRGTSQATLDAVSFSGPADGWAVGRRRIGQGVGVLVQHWDGTRWSLSPALNPPGTLQQDGVTVPMNAAATAVAAISPTDVWLAVTVGAEGLTGEPLHGGSYLEHWDGNVWTLVEVPNDDPRPILLTGLHAFSTNDVWAVGYHYRADGNVDPVALHWDGHTWTPSTMAGPGTRTRVAAVSGSSPNDVWAVGDTTDPVTLNRIPTTQHWDGTAWTVVAPKEAGSVASPFTRLVSVTAISDSDVWAVGDFAGSRAGGLLDLGRYLVLHWDGREWTRVSTPEPTNNNHMFGVSASSSDNVWISAAKATSAVPQSKIVVSPYLIRYGCAK